jgi:antitoxin (DNA-binding transcriptional repressor) of toxin-antitoxin stability system
LIFRKFKNGGANLSLVISGQEVTVTQAQKPVMRLVPVQTDVKPRVAGLHAGMGWMSDDFDAPLPDEFWAGTA